MPIIITDSFGSKGKKDAKRHRDKQREAIKERLPEIISEESLITQRKGKTVKIPIKSIQIPSFRPKRDNSSGGIGQGKGRPGDIIGQRPGDTYEPGQAGQEPGEDYIETEIEIEELIELILEDLGLPRLEEKEAKDLIVSLGYKIKGTTTAGPFVLLDRRKTVQEGIRRFWAYLKALQNESGSDDLTCYKALKKASGSLEGALAILKSGLVLDIEALEIEPFPIIFNEDMRFKKIEEDVQKQSSAVIIAMMDVSGSMDDMKKYLSRSMLLWLTEFLKKIYDEVTIRFIVHHTVAKNVDEDLFFHTMESGGTNCYTAYELANNLIDTEYPTHKWNVYIWHFSDGDDSNPDRTIEEVVKLIDKKVNMIGYGQVMPTTERNFFAASTTLWEKFKNYFQLEESVDEDVLLISGNDQLPFLGVTIEDREEILPALKAFLKKDRWSK